jgi:hypothetical protein
MDATKFPLIYPKTILSAGALGKLCLLEEKVILFRVFV